MLKTLASLAAIAALAATAAAGDAAARAMPTDYGEPVVQHALKPDRVVHLEVFPAGPDADEAACSGYDSRMNFVQMDMMRDIKAGDGEGAANNAEALGNLEDMALDAGCAVIY